MNPARRSAVSYWYPKVSGVTYWIPKTEIVPYEGEDSLYYVLDGEEPDGWEELIGTLRDAAIRVGGYPVFLRSGWMSGKHNWENTCYVPDDESMPGHVAAIIQEHGLAFGVPDPTEFTVREMLDLDTRFHAFRGNMPINVEFRAFADQEGCHCIHPYWPKGSIRNPDRGDWREVLSGMHDLWIDDRQMMETQTAELVLKKFDGAWSVDWARHSDGRWFLIDMAPAGMSHHQEGCENVDRWADPRGSLP